MRPQKNLDLQAGFGLLNPFLYGGCGEAVNTYDCDSYIRGFDTLQPPQKLQLAIIMQVIIINRLFRVFGAIFNTRASLFFYVRYCRNRRNILLSFTD